MLLVLSGKKKKMKQVMRERVGGGAIRGHQRRSIFHTRGDVDNHRRL